jgi:hypothetical protein
MFKHRRILAVLMVASGGLGATLARGAAASAEDLSACKLPNGVVIMPAPGSPAARTGEILKLSTGRFTWYPTEPGRTLSPAQAAEKLRATNAADLEYLPENEGTLWAVSGHISELGALYLADAAALKMDAPMEIRATSRGPAGMYTGIAEGRTYLVQGADGHYSLVRVLEKTAQSLTIQYVNQPAGTLVFDVPRGDLVDFHRDPAASQPADAAAVRRPGPAGETPASASAASSSSDLSAPRIPSTLPAPAPRQALGPDDRVEPGVIILRSPSPPTALPSPSPSPGPRAGAAPSDPAVQPVPAPSFPAPSPQPGPAIASAATAVPPPAPLPAAAATPAESIVTLPPQELRPPPVAAAPSDPTLEIFFRQRDQLIQERLALLQAPAHTADEIDRKSRAMEDLGNLQAGNAADALASQITFLNTHSHAREFSMDDLHPAFAALKRLGKPATTAALAALEKIDLAAPGEGIDSPGYRAKLLAMVIRSVEGNEAGDFILRRQMQLQNDTSRRALFEYILTNN